MMTLMYNPNKLSKNTKKYLTRFYDILDEMIREMSEADLSDSISQNFIVQMLPHHRAAIEMSKNILQYTTCIPLQNIAENIIVSQTKSIQTMCNILDNCSLQCSYTPDMCLYHRNFQRIAGIMFQAMDHAYSTNQMDADFIREMIPHHHGAVRMSENALRFDICPELVPILDTIIQSQSQGIREMKHLLNCIDRT